VIHEHLNLEIDRGEIVGIAGGSGSGKSVLLRCIIMLIQPSAGDIFLLGQATRELDDNSARTLRQRIGMMFQGGALFNSLTVIENVTLPLRLYTELSERSILELGMTKLMQVGLALDAAAKYPAQISGGMVKRVAVARALALDPEILFLDEPTAGLDPVAASGIDELLMELRETLDLTIVLVTHDLDSLATVTDRVAFLAEQRVVACAPIRTLARSTLAPVAAFFSNPRARLLTEHG
jgi:phospholipid/cholesterol/gamma-HCH transport system ATP-binding protein